MLTSNCGGKGGDRQRREKALPFLKEEKSEHERARQYEIAIQLVCARHCELPLSKMGSKGLFPVVAVPLAFFGTFFRFERKYCPPQGGSPSVRAVVGASSSSEGVLMTKLAHIDACRGLSARPLHPFGSPSETNQQPHGAAPTLPRQSQCVSPSPSPCKPPYEW